MEVFFSEVRAIANGPLLTSYTSCMPTNMVVVEFKKRLQSPSCNGEMLLTKVFDEIMPDLIKEFEQVFQALPILDNLSLLQELNVKIAISMMGPENPDLSVIFAQNTRDYTTLKERLVTQDFAKAATFNIRSEKLFKWCSAVIAYIVHAPLESVWDHPQKEEKVSTLNIVATKLAVFDTRIDDIADNIQDLKLTKYFCEICTSSDKELEKLRGKIRAYCGGIYEDFFEGTVALWKDITGSLKSLFEVESLDKFLPFNSLFKEHMAKLMEAMNYSVKMNTEKVSPTFLEMETNLSSNMLVQLLFDFQLALLQQSHTLPASKEFNTRFQEMTKTMEKMFHHANCFATFERELMEMDSTNPLFKIADDLYKGAHEVAKKRNPNQTFSEYIQVHFETSEEIKVFSLMALIVPGDREEQFSEMKALETWCIERDLLKESILLRSHHYLDAQEKLLSVVSTLEDSSPPEINLKITNLKKTHATNLIRINLVRKMIMKKDVIEEYFLHWMSLYQKLSIDIQEVKSVLKKEGKLTDQLEKALGQYQINSALFLINYLVYSRVKGAV